MASLNLSSTSCSKALTYVNKEIHTSCSPQSLIHGAKEIAIIFKPEWKSHDLSTLIFNEGSINRLIGVYIGDKMTHNTSIVIRVNGENTDVYINRQQEIECYQLMESLSYGPKLYGHFLNGLCYAFQEGTSIQYEQISNIGIAGLIARKMASMHSITPSKYNSQSGQTSCEVLLNISLNNYPFTFSDIAKQEVFAKLPPLSELKAEIDYILSVVRTFNSPIVFSHNDLNMPNILYDATNGRINFIDFEFAGDNYRGFDVGNHFCEFAGIDNVDYSHYPTLDFQLNWIRIYLEEWNKLHELSVAVEHADTLRFCFEVNVFALLSHLTWGIWAVIQSKLTNSSFNFISYAKIRLDEYYARKELVINSKHDFYS